MAKRPGPRSLRDVRAGLVCAEAFQKLAEPFIERIATDLREGTQDHPSIEIGDLVACATNLAFALELYMKTLLAQLELTIPHTHDLRHLYDAIPHQVRTQIEHDYDDAWRSQWYGRRASITVAKGPLDQPAWNDYRKDSKQLGELLRRSCDLFQSWRYIYELTEPEDGAYQFHQFEYGLLLCACQAIRASVMTHLDEMPRES